MRLRDVFSTISFVQGILVPASALVVGLEALFIPAGELRTIIMAFTTAVFTQLVTSFRKPSTAGGTVAPAAQIAPDTKVGEPLTEAPEKK